MILSPWLSYLIGESRQLSGIMSVFCNGIFLAHYASPNLNAHSWTIMRNIYGMTSHISETTVFLFIGISLSAFNHPYLKMGVWLFLGGFVIVNIVSWFLNVAAIFKLSNIHRWKYKEKQVSRKFQFVIWVSGLRGAMALALALEARHTLVNGDVILLMTLLYSLFSVLIVGSALGPAF